MDILDEEILNLWKSFEKNNVLYIMVGGFATNLHGYPRITADVDIWIKDTLDNRKRLRRSLQEINVGDYPPLETMQFVPGWSSITLNSGIELDIMSSLKGLDQLEFDGCFELAPVALIDQVPVRFLHINHLITVKKALGRPKDIEDVEALEKIKKGGL